MSGASSLVRRAGPWGATCPQGVRLPYPAARRQARAVGPALGSVECAVRVKAFSHETAEDLEHTIDAWLAQHPAITIVAAVQSMGRSFAGDRIVLTLFYAEPTQADHAPQRDRSEWERTEGARTEQSPQPRPPRPAMAPPSSGMGRASPLPPDTKPDQVLE